MSFAPTPPHLAQVLGLLRWLLILVFVVMGWVVLSYLAHILAPIVAALGIAYLLSPVLDVLVRRGLSRAAGAGLLLVSFIGIIAVALTLAVPAVVGQASEFLDDLPRYVTNLSVWVHDRFGLEVPTEWREQVTSERLQQAFSATSGPLAEIASAAVGGVFSVLSVLAELLLIPVFAFYFLVDWPYLLRRIEHMVPPRRRANVRALAREIDRVVAGWVRGQGIVTAILAVSYAIGFTLVGMPLSVPIGLVVGALTVIPFVGTIVGAGIAGLVTLADGGSMHTLGMVGAVIVLLHILEAGVLTPKIVGHRVGLSESAALIAVIAGGKLLGFVGIVLAVPIAATFAVLVRHAVRYYETTAFFGHESETDVPVTPAMALIIPGMRVDLAVISAMAADEATILEKELELRAGPMAADPVLEPELGPPGAAPRTKIGP